MTNLFTKQLLTDRRFENNTIVYFLCQCVPYIWKKLINLKWSGRLWEICLVKIQYFIRHGVYYEHDRKDTIFIRNTRITQNRYQNVSPFPRTKPKYQTFWSLFKHQISPLFVRFPKLPILLELYISCTGHVLLNPRKLVW